MNLFAGLSRTDYEDLYRAVGALIDERGWTNVSLIEVDEGLVVQVLIKPDQRELHPHLETYLLTDNDLERIMSEAVMRRRIRTAPAPAAGEPRHPLLAPTPGPDDGEDQVLPTTTSPSSPWPVPSGIVQERLTTMALQSNARTSGRSFDTDDEPLPPLPPLDLPGSSSRSSDALIGLWADEDDRVPAASMPTLSPSPSQPSFSFGDDGSDPFAPAPMRLSATPAPPPPPAFNAGAARAAVVMAHIVAARLKSGAPMTLDDPDLASLLDQVRALDDADISKP